MTEPTRSESAWIDYLDGVEIPVLRRTVEELARLRGNEDRVTARDISHVLLHDPMLTLRVLRYLQMHRRAAQTAEITTAEHALMMLGIGPFFSIFVNLPVVESFMENQPEALEGLLRVLYRAHHAMLYAHDWASQRQDLRANEIAIAVLLHDLAEMLFWCFAPNESLKIAALRCSDETLRSNVAQTTVLGFKLSDLQAKLIAQWQLAPMFRALIDESYTPQARATNMELAVNLARHSADGWDNPALPDDYVEIQHFLKLPPPEMLARIHSTALKAMVARDWYHQENAPVPPDLSIPRTGLQETPGLDDN